MASALGTTVEPEGSTGTVTALRHMPDQLPDNPSTILANTSIETIQNILNENWIWRNSFTIDPTMRPGQIFGTIKIHPRNCNEYITHISQMFLTWTGSMKIRTRFMATFQFGGSIRLGYLPPKFSQSQVNTLPITTLTAYPNVDLDPKNTDWVFFQASDERNVLFHWMNELTDDNPESFAGWFVFYIASPLVLSGGTSTQISLLVEAAGGFNFSQLAPISAIVPIAQGWLDPRTAYDILSQAGCDDAEVSVGSMCLQVLPIAIKQLDVGFANARMAGKYTTDLCPGSTCINGVLDAREGFQGSIYPSSTFHGSWYCPTTEPNGHIDFVRGYDVSPGNFVRSSRPLPSNVERFGVTIATLNQNDLGPRPYYSAFKRYTAERGTYASNGWSDSTTSLGYLTAQVSCGWYNVMNHDPTPVDVVSCDYVSGNSVLVNPLPNESIVVFSNITNRTFQTQTMQMSQQLDKIPLPLQTTSQLYSLFAVGTVGPIMVLRLQPSGLFTTNATVAEAVLRDVTSTGPLYLEYLQDLPMSSPLPDTGLTRKNLALFARATRKAFASISRFREMTTYML
jgi:hypothetical protein